MAGEDRTDLEAFVRLGSQDAFARLAGRYARMVYAACLSQLGSREDAEDSAQAVFLILARKAGGIRPDRVGSWLYGAAMRTSRFMARGLARRARHELVLRSELLRRAAEEAGQMRASAESVGGSGAAEVPAEVRRQLMAEVERLPAALRETVVRHYLGGQTRAQMAAELGVPPGTVNSRLNAGLERLRERLASRGTVLGLAALGSVLAGAVSGSVPASLLASLPALASGSTAALAAAGAGSHVVALAEGVLRMMFWEKVKFVAVAASLGAAAAVAVPVAAVMAADNARPAVVAPANPAPVAAAPAAAEPAEPAKPAGKAPATVIVTGKVVGIRGNVASISNLSGPVRLNDKATCKAKGWTSTVTNVVRADLCFVKLADGAANGDAVEIETEAAQADGISWGQAVGGLRLGLAPAGGGENKALFLAGDPLTFNLHFRAIVDGNLKLVHASPALPDFKITFTAADKSSRTARFDPAALAPNAAGQVPPITINGSQDQVCPLVINDQWKFVGDDGGTLKALPVGRYTVQVAYEPKQVLGERWSIDIWRSNVTSGTVEIEIKANPKPVGLTPARIPVTPRPGHVGGGGGGAGGGGGGGR